MAKKKSKSVTPVQLLRQIGLSFPEAEEGTSCNKAAFKGRKKSYLFVGHDETSYNVMVKLNDSLEQAQELEAAHPENYSVGAHGWTTLRFALDESPGQELLQSWIEESFRLIVPKTLLRIFEESQ